MPTDPLGRCADVEWLFAALNSVEMARRHLDGTATTNHYAALSAAFTISRIRFAAAIDPDTIKL